MRFLVFVSFTSLLIDLLPDNVCGQNLIVQTNARVWRSFFKNYSYWVESLRGDGLASQLIERKLRVGRMQAYGFELTAVNVAPALLYLQDGSYYVQVPIISATIDGTWKYRLLLFARRGKFTLQLRDMNVTLGKIVPIQYDGLPFIDPQINCTLEFEHFTHSLSKMTMLSRTVHAFLDRIVRFEIEKIIADTMVSNFDSFLRNGVEQIALRHLLQKGSVMNNALVGQPVITPDGNLITFHVGKLDEEKELDDDTDFVKTKDILDNFRYLPQGDVIYAVNVKMIAEVIRAAYNRSAFDWDFSDSDGYALVINCSEVPEVAVKADKIELKLKQDYQFYSMNSHVFNKTEEQILFLKAYYSHNFQLHLKLAVEPMWRSLGNEVQARFGFKLQRRAASVISSQLMIPLPVARGTVAHNAAISYENDYIVFVSFLSSVV